MHIQQYIFHITLRKCQRIPIYVIYLRTRTNLNSLLHSLFQNHTTIFLFYESEYLSPYLHLYFYLSLSLALSFSSFCVCMCV